MRFSVPLLLLSFAFVSFSYIWPSSVQAEETKPNVIVIIGDDMGYADIGIHGCKDIPTPAIDQIAKSGIRFTNGYVSGPYCSPTRAGFLTGKYQTRFGHEFNPSGNGPNQGLSTEETLLPELMQKAGYRTGLVGKWHLGSQPKFLPTSRGFEEFFGFLGGAHAYIPNGEENQAPIFRGAEKVEEREYLTDAFAREAVSFIDRHKSEPFFLYLAFNAVHTPMHADDARLAKFSSIEDPTRRKYAAMMSAMDDAIHQVQQKLEAESLSQNTIVIFFSDNGGPTMKGTTMNGSSNAPLRGSKRTCLEGGVRVPFFIQWPKKIEAGLVRDNPVIQLDFMPTLLTAIGRSDLIPTSVDGVSLVDQFAKDFSPNEGLMNRELFWRFGNQMAIRKGDWKLVKYDLAVDNATGVSPMRLYNLKSDLAESVDLSSKEPEKVKELEALWKTWNQSNVPAKWGAGNGAAANNNGKAAANKGNKKQAVKTPDK